MQQSIDIRVAPNGRMVLPRAIRNVLGVTGAGVVVLSIDGDVIKLSSMRQNVNHTQALYRAHATNDLSSAEFIDERRADAAKDQLESGAD